MSDNKILKSNIVLVFVCFISILYSLYIFYPWPFKDVFIGPIGGDNFLGSFTYFTVIDNLFNENSRLAWPEGIKINLAANLLSLVETTYFIVINITFGPLTAITSYAFINIILNGIIFYLFIFKLTKKYYTSFLGLIFGLIVPHSSAMMHASVSYSALWPLIIFLWFGHNLIEIKKEKTIHPFLYKFLLPMSIWVTPYYTYLLSILFVILIVYVIFLNYSKSLIFLSSQFKYIKPILISYIIYYFIAIKFSYTLPQMAQSRKLNDFFEQSIHPLHLVMPSMSSYWPDKVSQMRTDLISRTNDSDWVNAYLGISVILSVFLLIILNLKKTRFVLFIKNSKYFHYLIIIFIVITLFSFPPKITNFVYLPSHITYYLVPQVRAGQRFAPLIFIIFVTIFILLLNNNLKLPRNFKIKNGLYILLMIIYYFDLGLNKFKWMDELQALQPIENKYYPWTVKSTSLEVLKDNKNIPVVILPYEFYGRHAGASFAFYFINWIENPILNRGGFEVNGNIDFYTKIEEKIKIETCRGIKELNKLNLIIIVENYENNYGLWKSKKSYDELLQCLNLENSIVSFDKQRKIFGPK